MCVCIYVFASMKLFWVSGGQGSCNSGGYTIGMFQNGQMMGNTNNNNEKTINTMRLFNLAIFEQILKTSNFRIHDLPLSHTHIQDMR